MHRPSARCAVLAVSSGMRQSRDPGRQHATASSMAAIIATRAGLKSKGTLTLARTAWMGMSEPLGSSMLMRRVPDPGAWT